MKAAIFVTVLGIFRVVNNEYILMEIRTSKIDFMYVITLVKIFHEVRFNEDVKLSKFDKAVDK